MAFSSVANETSKVPERVPLDQHAPNIYTVAQWTLNNLGEAQAFIEMIATVADHGREANEYELRHRLTNIKEVANTVRSVIFGWHNDRGCEIENCMRASESLDVRAALVSKDRAVDAEIRPDAVHEDLTAGRPETAGVLSHDFADEVFSEFTVAHEMLEIAWSVMGAATRTKFTKEVELARFVFNDTPTRHKERDEVLDRFEKEVQESEARMLGRSATRAQ